MEYQGPDSPERVVVAFPPFDYPWDAPQSWGGASFKKRDIANVCVFHRKEEWHQYPDFFDAMAACRASLGDSVPITAYGFSMGGYGALLGARALNADRTVAISPQFSIDPGAVRFERRYQAQWAEMGDWLHDLGQAMDDIREYIVIFDPLHRKDRRHESRLPRRAGYKRILMHGAGHAAIQTCVEMGIQEVFFDLLLARVDVNELRQAYRARRTDSFRYLRRVGTILHEKDHPMANHFWELARTGGHRRLLKKWRAFHDADNAYTKRQDART